MGFYQEVDFMVKYPRDIQLPFLDNTVRFIGRYGELNIDEKMVQNSDKENLTMLFYHF